MSASEAANRPGSKSGTAKIWLALAALIAVAVALAWIGAGGMRGETTASGLYLRTIEEGSGAPIQPVDGVLIEYEGRLEDGSVFDSSEGRGPTPMIAGQVIPGFAEALTRMQQGGRYRVKIPASLAYGASPPPGSPIPPNADLTFDVHVVQVVPNAALMMQGQQGQLPPGAGAEQGPPQPSPEAPRQP
jgi:FKBP-type peptidyl-prolyl cis-trans isomerase FkpA